MCGHHVTYVHQVGSRIWAQRWNNVNNVLCEIKSARRSMRKVENRCNRTSTPVWLVHGKNGGIAISNPEEMDDTELLKDLSSLGKPPSFDGKDTMLINTEVDTRETSILESNGQKYRREILPVENTSSLAVLEREWTNKTEPSEKWTIEWTSTSRCRRFSTLSTLLMILLRYSERFCREPRGPNIEFSSWRWTLTQRFLSPLTWRTRSLASRLPRRLGTSCSTLLQHATESSHIASTKEIVEDDTVKTASRSQSKVWTTNTANSRLSRRMSRTHSSAWFRPSITENRSISENWQRHE